MKDTPKLTADQVLAQARQALKAHLPVQAHGYKCTTDDVLHILLTAAARQCTIEAACAELKTGPGAQTVRQYLNQQWNAQQLGDLQRQLNDALATQLPRRLGRQAQDLAIDLHDRPYYGKTTQADGLWVRSEAKDGTTRFYRVATVYVIHRGLRLTLAVHFVLPADQMVDVLARLVGRVKQLGIAIQRLFLDKGFTSIDVQTYLQANRVPALIACPIRGRSGGTRALCRGHKSYRTTHTFRNRAANKAHTAEMAVCRVFARGKRTGRMKRRAGWLVFILINLDLEPRQARGLYRRRFGVETSYRCAGQVRAWTTGKNPALRFVLIGLSFLLLDVWLQLRWHYTQVARRGRRRLDTRRFTLARFARFIVRAVEQRYGCILEIVAPAAPIP